MTAFPSPPKSTINSPTPTISCIEEALKEKEKPKEEEREKPKDAPGVECKPRPLHKTCSLFMRNIAPNISRAEIISVSGENALGAGTTPKLHILPGVGWGKNLGGKGGTLGGEKII